MARCWSGTCGCRLIPRQRTWMMRDSYKPQVPLGEVMQSFAVGQVLESRHPDFKAGDLVKGDFGWQDYAATHGKIPQGAHRAVRFNIEIRHF